ncbi:GYF domain-containing protein [Akkermansia sp. N21116]|jgi:hypothetical protein|uniref:GYF domain-containing protein n=1 Tax=Akkermansia sp. N21116 TaxID=3040764 RepID=UPI00244E81B2|nr:GYF domain-containing protein [Akkermansia sp. N21116]WPX40848.1 GYF domain-containing protein [Akkermansia sp. N21116]
MKKYFICDNSENQQGPYSEHVLKALYEDGTIQLHTRIREIQSSEWGVYSDIVSEVSPDKNQKDIDESTYLIALPDGEQEGPYTQEQIVALYRNGRLASNLLCCRVGSSSWNSLETVIGKNSQQTIPADFSGRANEVNPPSFSSEDNESSPLRQEIPPTPNTPPPLEENASYRYPPLQDERSYTPRQEYNMRAFWAMSMLYILSPLLIIVAEATYAGDIKFTLTVLGIGVLFSLYAQILLLMNTRKAWKCIQPVTQYGRRIPSAGKAVGLLFIPVFNLYWMYVCFVGLADNASWLARVTQQTNLRLKAWPMFVFVLLTQFTFWGSIITNAFLPEFRSYFHVIFWLCLLWAIVVFWYTERIIQSFPRPQRKKKKSA